MVLVPLLLPVALAREQQEQQTLVLAHPRGKSYDSQEALKEHQRPEKGLEVRLHNVTLAGQKLWQYLDGFGDDDKPEILCLNETHLMGVPLNRARRRARNLGWHWFGTAAIPSIRDEVEEHVANHANPREARTFANHGEEATLAQPKLVTTGHHQDPEAQGFRSTLEAFTFTSSPSTSMLVLVWTRGPMRRRALLCPTWFGQSSCHTSLSGISMCLQRFA